MKKIIHEYARKEKIAEIKFEKIKNYTKGR